MSDEILKKLAENPHYILSEDQQAQYRKYIGSNTKPNSKRKKKKVKHNTSFKTNNTTIAKHEIGLDNERES